MDIRFWARRRRCWGAMCCALSARKKRARAFAWCALAFGLALLGWLCKPSPSLREYPAAVAVSSAALPAPQQARPNSAVVYRYPSEGILRQVAYTRQELLRGKLLLIDAEHPISEDAPQPNTLCIAARGKGLVPVRDLSLKTAQETLDALCALFRNAREHQMEGLAVFRATLSPAEQRNWQLERMRAHALSTPLEEALAAARREVDEPGQSEHQQGYAVDIRLYKSWNGPPDERATGDTAQGRFLLQNAWRHGFILRYPNAISEDKAFHYRFVGTAHSTAMTYLDLTLESYLALLHERQVLQILKDGKPRYLIVCQPIVDGYAAFTLPEGIPCEVSADNLGYAVAACTYPDE